MDGAIIYAKIIKRRLRGVIMKKKKHIARKLRKCERGIKTKSINKGFRYEMTNRGLIPVSWYSL